jgi:hypothetical protein
MALELAIRHLKHDQQTRTTEAETEPALAQELAQGPAQEPELEPVRALESGPVRARELEAGYRTDRAARGSSSQARFQIARPTRTCCQGCSFQQPARWLAQWAAERAMASAGLACVLASAATYAAGRETTPKSGRASSGQESHRVEPSRAPRSQRRCVEVA